MSIVVVELLVVDWFTLNTWLSIVFAELLVVDCYR